jgi:TetR/AcrR family transcriptional repressor of nem operon
MRYSGQHKQETRARVLECAARTMRLVGPEALGIATVMKEAGLTHGGFYAHFRSRDDLIVATIDTLVGHAYQRFVTCTDGRTPADGLRAYVDFYFSNAHRDSVTRGCPLPVLSGDMGRLSVAVRERFSEAIIGLAAQVAPLIRSLGHADADDLARSFIAEAVGAIALARVLGATPASDAILNASRNTVLARLHLAGGRA